MKDYREVSEEEETKRWMAENKELENIRLGFWSSLPCFEDKTTEVTWKINVAERTIIFSKLYKK